MDPHPSPSGPNNMARQTALLVALAAIAAASPLARAGKVIRGRYVDVGPIAAVECDVTKFGAKGDGKTDDTKAVQAAFAHCGQSGGGTVVVPAPKTFLIFSVHFTSSNQELHIEAGATLLGSDDVEAWGSGKVGSAIIVAGAHGKNATALQHIAITGGGTVGITARRRNVLSPGGVFTTTALRFRWTARA